MYTYMNIMSCIAINDAINFEGVWKLGIPGKMQFESGSYSVDPTDYFPINPHEMRDGVVLK